MKDLSTLPDGLHHGLTFPEYVAIDAVGHSGLKPIGKSPLHYKHARDNRGEDKPPMRLGRAGHTAVLEPERFITDFAMWTWAERDAFAALLQSQGKKIADSKADREKPPVKNGLAWEAFEAAHPTKTIITDKEYALALAMSRAVRSRPDARRYLDRGKPEVTLLWHDAPTGIRCKARVDWLSDAGAIVDLKSARDVAARPFGRSAASYGYHTQAAFYVDGLRAATGQDLPFVLLAVESAAPHDTAIRRVTGDAFLRGRSLCRTWLELLEDCMRDDEWPGVAPEEEDLDMPLWDDNPGEPLELDTTSTEAAE